MKKIFFYLTLTFVYCGLYAQDHQIVNENSTLTISGGSTLHDWTVTANQMDGTLTMVGDSIMDINLEFASQEIKSERGPDMDAKIVKALKGEEYEKIAFTAQVAVKGDNSTYHTTGTLNIAGEERDIEVSSMMEGDRLKGSVDISFSQFNIEPPSALFGTIKCKDPLVVNWDVQIKSLAK